MANDLGDLVTSPVAVAQENYREVNSTFSRLGIDPGRELGDIWRENVDRFLRPLIETGGQVQDIFQALNNKSFFDYTAPQKYIAPAYEWYTRNIDGFWELLRGGNALLEESDLIPHDRVQMISERRISTDFLNKVCIAGRLQARISSIRSGSILEIGAGYGSLARLIKKLNMDRQYIIFDLPETLFFCEIFLRSSFPDLKITYCSDPDLARFAAGDFVLVPAQFRDLVRSYFDTIEIALALNTNSFGEMPLKISTEWTRWLDERPQVHQIFSLNRFLNSVDKKFYRGRRWAAGFNLCWPKRWQVLEWEVNPRYEQCPYFTSIFTRNLHLLLTKDALGSSLHEPDLSSIKLQDWSLLPGWKNFSLVENAGATPLHSKMTPDLTPDLTQRGILFSLWETHRNNPGSEATELLERYLLYLSGPAHRFEESLYLASLRLQGDRTLLRDLWQAVGIEPKKKGFPAALYKSLRRRLSE